LPAFLTTLSGESGKKVWETKPLYKALVKDFLWSADQRSERLKRPRPQDSQAALAEKIREKDIDQTLSMEEAMKLL
jgi:hypothetical protein